VLTFEQKESRSNAAALHKNRGFEVECQFHLQESNLEVQTMANQKREWQDKSEACILGGWALRRFRLFAQQAAPRDRQNQRRKAATKALTRPAGRVVRAGVDEKSMRALIAKLVACGTRLTLSSWEDAKRGAGCGRDAIAARLNEIAKDSGGKLQVVVDKFESTSERTSGKPIPWKMCTRFFREAMPAGEDDFYRFGAFDSRPSNVMDPEADAPGADDDASGVAVSLECARC